MGFEKVPTSRPVTAVQWDLVSLSLTLMVYADRRSKASGER
jgi:hypothetical protein